MTEQSDVRRLLDQAEGAKAAGDFASADTLLRSAARIQEEELGPLHPDLANTLNNLAVVAEMTGRSSEAERLYRRGVAIAAAALPAGHPMVVASRQNLEDFCRARGLPIDPPAVAASTGDVEPQSARAASPADSTPRFAVWVAIGAVALVAAVLLVLRLSSSRAVSVREAATPAAQPTTPIRPPADARAAVPVPPAHPAPTTAAPRRDSRTAGADKLPVAGVTVVTAQVCRSFAATGSSWRCDAVGRSAPPGSMVLYTRVKSPRDTAVWHRWYRGNTLRQSVMLNIQANATDGYRTYSRLTLEEGDWRIEVRSADGELLYEQRLTVR